MRFKQFATLLRTSITLLMLLWWHHAAIAQSQPAVPEAKPSVPQTDSAKYPEAPQWVYASFHLLARVGLSEPLEGSQYNWTRYQVAVALARLLNRMESAKTFALPTLAQTNADFYTRDAQGNWLPRYTRADVKAEFLKLWQEFAPELARLGPRVDFLSARIDETTALDRYFAEPTPQPAPKIVEAHIRRAELLSYLFSTRDKTTADFDADIALPAGCQLAVLPTWSWQIVNVRWRATTHDAWSIKPPAYTATLISPEQAPTALYECGLANAGQWQITAQATVRYETTTSGSGTAVATGSLEIPTTLFEPHPSSGGLPQPPSIFMPRTQRNQHSVPH